MGLKVLPAVFGGATRQASVRAGLEALAAYKPELVLAHDAARPFASLALIARAIAAAQKWAAAAGLQVGATVKTAGTTGPTTGRIQRASRRRGQTPQSFA